MLLYLHSIYHKPFCQDVLIPAVCIIYIAAECFYFYRQAGLQKLYPSAVTTKDVHCGFDLYITFCSLLSVLETLPRHVGKLIIDYIGKNTIINSTSFLHTLRNRSA